MIELDPFDSVFADLRAYEDAQQASALTHPPIVLPYDPLGRLIAGPFSSRDAAAVAQSIITGHLTAGRQVASVFTTLRPWWRLWRPTRAIRITVQARAVGFEQDFSDGGPE